MKEIENVQRRPSPAVTPQALAWDGTHLWMGSRDLQRVYRIEVGNWKVLEEIEPPGIPWAAVSLGKEIAFTIGLAPDDDRYLYRYAPNDGFKKSFAFPEFTGSYLSFDGEHLYLSQWYKGRILKLDQSGQILHTIQLKGEISGHVFVDNVIYVLHGTEKDGESWAIARVDPREETPKPHDLAWVPFACRSLTFDGNQFWSNHRAANETVSFSLPG
jgi:hypothetical protein